MFKSNFVCTITCRDDRTTSQVSDGGADKPTEEEEQDKEEDFYVILQTQEPFELQLGVNKIQLNATVRMNEYNFFFVFCFEKRCMHI